jgi:toxin FitB
LKYLLDTNTISEPKRKRPDPNAATWLRGADQAALYVSVLTLGEIENGITTLARNNPTAANTLSEWAQGIRLDFSDRILGIDLDVAETWGRISAERSLPVIDGLLAATALVHGMTLVTRNVRDIHDTGVAILNPWEG